LSVSIFLALVLEVCRNRFSCHGQSMAELAPSKLSNFGHSLTIHDPPRRGASWMGLSAKAVDFLRQPPYSWPERTYVFLPTDARLAGDQARRLTVLGGRRPAA
jgi:hypothetical protein